jgi:hypothetical protein
MAFAIRILAVEIAATVSWYCCVICCFLDIGVAASIPGVPANQKGTIHPSDGTKKEMFQLARRNQYVSSPSSKRSWDNLGS